MSHHMTEVRDLHYIEILVNAELMDACGLEMPLALQGCPVCGGKGFSGQF